MLMRNKWKSFAFKKYAEIKKKLKKNWQRIYFHNYIIQKYLQLFKIKNTNRKKIPTI